MATSLLGPTTWSMERDAEGHRTYRVTYKVRSNDKADGPGVVLNTSGLPQYGDFWQIGNESDTWAWLTPEVRITPIEDDGDPTYHWLVEMVFSTKPVERNKQRCNDSSIDNPLLEPAKISGSTRQKRVSPSVDRFGNDIVNSAFQPAPSESLDFDRGYGVVRIEQNILTLQEDLIYGMLNCVNDAPLWGLPRRCVRLSDFNWETKYYGLCYKYYTRTLEFTIDADGFDIDLLDESTKVLSGDWSPTQHGVWVTRLINGEAPDPFNPAHFIPAVSPDGNPMKIILNGAGVPANVVSRSGYFISISDGNLGNGLSDTDFWIPLLNTDPILWEPDVLNPRGRLVEIISDQGVSTYYVASSNERTNEPPGVGWVEITDLTDRGEYSSIINYQLGDYILAGDSETGPAGRIYVEYYDEANFLLLGIPTAF